MPVLQAAYAGLVVLASGATTDRSVAELRAAGAIVERQADAPATIERLGAVRRAALALGLRTRGQHFHFCDWDRVLHWAARYPDELGEVISKIPRYDCLILGRTARAFATHPRVQRDTESIVNHCFGLVWGQELDVTAASRGFSRAAVERIVEGCDEPTLGNDCAWPLFLRRDVELRIGYLRTEGLEWETPDRYVDQIAAMGGPTRWLSAHDADVARWADRLELARIEVDALRRWREKLMADS